MNTLNKYIGHTEAICPYCNKELKKFPKAKTKCPNCGNYIYKRTRPFDNRPILIKESQIEEIEKEWEKKFETPKISLLTKIIRLFKREKINHLFALPSKPIYKRIFKEQYKKDLEFLYSCYTEQYIEKENICPYCKKQLDERKKQICPHCGNRIYKIYYKTDIFGNNIFVNATLENQEKYIKTKLFIDYIFLDIFDWNLSLFNEIKKSLQKTTGHKHIPLWKIVWEKLQFDELDVSCQKRLPYSERLEMLGEVYSKRGAIMDFIEDKRAALNLSLQGLHYKISCGADYIGVKFDIKKYIKDNNISREELENIYLEQEIQSKGGGGLYEMTPYSRTLHKAMKHIYS